MDTRIKQSVDVWGADVGVGATGEDRKLAVAQIIRHDPNHVGCRSPNHTAQSEERC